MVLQQWAQFGRTYAPQRASQPNWSSVERLIVAAKPWLREEATTLRGLLEEWSRKFGIQDPLLNDLGAHRWIDKETSYSDWLAWVLERLEPSTVFEVLGVKPPPGRTGKCQVQRESQLDERYIDLLIRFDGIPDYAIGVEIKTYDEQYAKQQDYLKSLRSRYRRDTPCILIAIPEDIDKDQLCDFTLRPWRKVTLALRAKIEEYARNHGEDTRIITAMMLGFVAAVEQNLLGFSPRRPDGLRRMSQP